MIFLAKRVFGWTVSTSWIAMSAFAMDDRALPTDYEFTGGHSLGWANAGMAASSDISALQLNPANLAFSNEYSISGHYMLSENQRSLFHLGVHDAKSSPVAAAFRYTGFSGSSPDRAPRFDSIDRRFHLGVAKTLDLFSLGMSAQYFEAKNPVDLTIDPSALTDEEKAKVSGLSIGFGVAALLTPKLRAGLSVENINNRQYANYAPETWRGGIAYLLGDGATVNLDYRQRNRVEKFESLAARASVLGFGLSESDRESVLARDDLYRSPERMITVSGSVKVYDMLRVLSALGQEVGGVRRRSVSAGLALANKGFSFSYGLHRPNLQSQRLDQSVGAIFQIEL